MTTQDTLMLDRHRGLWPSIDTALTELPMFDVVSAWLYYRVRQRLALDLET